MTDKSHTHKRLFIYIISFFLIGFAYFIVQMVHYEDITLFTSLIFLASFACVFTGVVIHMYRLFKQSRENADLLANQNVTLQETREELENALKTTLVKEAELASKVQDLQRAKRAMGNVLKDLGQGKAMDEAILASIGEGMVVTDQEGNVMILNNKAQDMLGRKLQDVKGVKWSDLFRVEDEEGTIVPSHQQPIQIALLERNQLATSRYYMSAHDGVKFPVSITTSPVMIDEKIGGAVMVFRDITAEKDVDRMKTEFISLASHQLRTPLSAIRWYSEMLIDGDAGPLSREQKEFINSISQSTDRMIELVNALLNISRIESGRMIINPQPTDLTDLLQQVLDDLEIKLKQKDLKFVVSAGSSLPKINIDKKLIRQVYLNLLTNSIKYTPPHGEISVFISQKGDEIISQVRDNGYGIPKKEQYKIFQKFYRGENILNRETDGTGLGLYLVKTIIESSKGKIWFKSEQGQGTTFWFSLPLSGMLAKKGNVTLDT